MCVLYWRTLAPPIACCVYVRRNPMGGYLGAVKKGANLCQDRRARTPFGVPRLRFVARTAGALFPRLRYRTYTPTYRGAIKGLRYVDGRKTDAYAAIAIRRK